MKQGIISRLWNLFNGCQEHEINRLQNALEDERNERWKAEGLAAELTVELDNLIEGMGSNAL